MIESFQFPQAHYKSMSCRGNRFPSPLTILIPLVVFFASPLIFLLISLFPSTPDPLLFLIIHATFTHLFALQLAWTFTGLSLHLVTQLHQSSMYQFISPSANHSPIHSHIMSPIYLTLIPSIHSCTSLMWLFASIYLSHLSILHLSIHPAIILQLAFGRHTYSPSHFKVMKIFVVIFPFCKGSFI